jgi:hypothetical protein
MGDEKEDPSGKGLTRGSALRTDLSRLNFIPDCVILIKKTARFDRWA